MVRPRKDLFMPNLVVSRFYFELFESSAIYWNNLENSQPKHSLSSVLQDFGAKNQMGA